MNFPVQIPDFHSLASASSEVGVLSLAIFSLFWLLVIYGFFSLWAKRFCRLDYRALYACMGMMALIGPVGEVFVNSIYRHVTGAPLWQYLVLPVQQGDTSLYSFVVWSLYGFYFYLLQQRSGEYFSKRSEYYLALRVAVEGIVLEFLMNVASLFLLDTLIFYYFPADMGHLTTLLASPFYFLAGLLMVKTSKRFAMDPLFFGSMSFMVAFVFVFFCE